VWDGSGDWSTNVRVPNGIQYINPDAPTAMSGVKCSSPVKINPSIGSSSEAWPGLLLARKQVGTDVAECKRDAKHNEAGFEKPHKRRRNPSDNSRKTKGASNAVDEV
jgi:hypothetical protein